MTANITKVLTLEGDQVSWKQSQQAATQAVNANHKALDGNSASALAARAAIIQATTSVIKFADDSNTSTGALHRASGALQDQITWLEKHAGKSKIARDEIKALRDEEAKIKREIQQRIDMTGSGHYSISGPSFGSNPVNNPIGKLGAAAGMYVRAGTTPTADDVLIRASRGELVVPTSLVAAGAVDHLRGKIPGFAAGGLAGSYSGNIPGLTGFAASMEKAFAAAMTASMIGAMHSAIRSAASTSGGGLGRAGLRWLENLWTGAGGPGGGTAHVAAAIALAESGGRANAVGPPTPFGSALGIWQILGAVAPGNLFNPQVNALNAVIKYRDAHGFSPWVTFETGAYRQFMDSGGWLPPGPSQVYNGTGRPEHLVPSGGGGGNTYNITVNVPVSASPRETGRQIIEAIRQWEKGNGPGWRK